MSKLNEHLVPLKQQLDKAAQELTDKEWSTLRSILIIALAARRSDRAGAA